MNTKDLVNRFELLYPQSPVLSDLRRSCIDKDLSSIFRLLGTEHDDLRKLLLEENEWSLWKLLTKYTNSQFVNALKAFAVNDISIDEDCLSQGQILSKRWLIDELKKLDIDLGTVFICAGWYATLALMLFEEKIKLTKIRSFDMDESCYSIAETFNKPWVIDGWKFKASTKNILDIDYENDTYKVTKSNGETQELCDSPDTIINTSCEHIEDFYTWYTKIPSGKLLILQTNNYFDVDEHVNCSKNLAEFKENTPMKQELYSGQLVLEKYTRYMRIGYK